MAENNHMFDNGYVMRWISVSNGGAVQILTYGEGVNHSWNGVPGSVMGSLNEVLGVPIFLLLGMGNLQGVQNALGK